MLKVQEIRELIKLVDQSSIDEFVYENEGSKIKMKKNSGVTVTAVQPGGSAIEAAPISFQQQSPVHHVPAALQQETYPQESQVEVATQEDTTSLHKITSPMVGTFYSSPSPDTDNYVKPGSKVSKDSVVCIVEAMKLFNEIEAEIDGEIVEILVKNGQLVEYGQPLFTVKPE